MSNKNSATNLPGLRKSIRKVVIANNRRRLYSESALAASPVLSTKRKRANSTVDKEQSEPTPKRMAAEQSILSALANLQASMGELKQKVDTIPTKEDFDKIEANVRSMRQEIMTNSEKIEDISKKQDKERVDFTRNVERVIDQRLAHHKTLRSGVTTQTAQEAHKEEQYLLARRTILLWPVDLTAVAGNAVRGFMETVLEMPSTTTKSLNIERVDKVEQARRSKITNEVRVVFASSRERDIVQSFATNLAKSQGAAGVRMEIPEHLKGLFKLFEAHGAYLNRNFPGTKRSIKYDDPAQSMCMDVRLPSSDNWHRISGIEMRQIAHRQANSKKKNQQQGTDDQERTKIFSLGAGAEVPVVSEEEESATE